MIPWRTAAVGALVAAAAWSWWSRSDELRSVLAAAEQQLASHDYQGAVRTLEGAPPAVKSDGRFQVLSARVYAEARHAAERSGASPTVANPMDALQGFRVLIYHLAGLRADEERAQALRKKLLELVPADVELRAKTRKELEAVGRSAADELLYDTKFAQDQRAARVLHGVLQQHALGEFPMRHGGDRNEGTLYILFGERTSPPASERPPARGQSQAASSSK